MLLSRENRLLTGCLLLYFITLAFLIPRSFCYGDKEYWITWCTHIFNHGLGSAYQSGTNYNPVFLYILALFGKIQGSAEAIREHIHTLKLFIAVFDIIAAVSVLLVVKREESSFLPFILLLNSAYLYNTIIWGQMDSIHTAFILFALIAAIRHRPVWSLFFFIVAINTKLQSIIFLPLLLLIIIPDIKEKGRSSLIGLAAIILFQVMLILPFQLSGDLSILIANNLSGSVDRHRVLSMNAFNWWNLFFSGNLSELADTATFAGVSYRNWGLMLFFGLAGLALTPLIRMWSKQRMNLSLVFLSASLIPLLFFYFNTQMHERYVHPAVLFSAIYAFLSGRYSLYLLISAGYLLNMEKVLQFLQLKNYQTLIFDPRFISLLFLTAILTGFYFLGKEYYIKKQ